MTKRTWTFLLFTLLVAAYLVYAGVYIYRTSFVVAGERYFVLFDDAMISMRFAKNLAAGDGLVWNPGERVEGFTNPLWVIFMAFLHLLPVSITKISLLVQISGALFLAANLFFVWKLTGSFIQGWLAPFLAATLTAFYTPLNNWGLQGMEVSVLALALSAAAWLALSKARAGVFSPWLYVLLGITTLVRTDMAVPFLVFLGVLFLMDPAHRWRHLAWGLGLFIVFIAGQTVLRIWYYGDPLPNTYYLKMVGYPVLMRLARGAYVLVDFVATFNWLLFLLPLAGLFFRQDRDLLLLLLLVMGQIAYSTYVGGDAWEHKGGANRYLSVVMPLYFVGFTYSAAKIWEVLGAQLQNLPPLGGRVRFSPSWSQRVAALGFAGLVLSAMVNMNSIAGDIKSLERWVLLRQPIFIEGNKEYVQIALDLRELTRPTARIAVVTAGSIPYFSERYAIDLLGKCDPYIARLEARGVGGLRNLENFRPGHMKWDYDYSIGKLNPDVVVQMWEGSDEARPYLDRDYVVGAASSGLTYSFLRDSNAILWEQVNRPR